MIEILGDGIYDKLSNEEIIGSFWDSVKKKEAKNIHEGLKLGVESIIKESLLKKSLDNVTAIIVAFSNLEYKFSHFDMQDQRPTSRPENRYSA